MSDECSLYISNLSNRTYERDLQDIFEEYGRVLDCKLKDGNALIRYRSSDESSKALRKMNNTDLDGRKISVEYSNSRISERFGMERNYIQNKNKNSLSRERSRENRRYKKRSSSFRRSFSRSRSKSRNRSREGTRNRNRDASRSRSRSFQRRRRSRERYSRNNGSRERGYGSFRRNFDRDGYRDNRKSGSNFGRFGAKGGRHIISDSQIRGYRIDVHGLSSRTSWQDLKDFARNIGPSITYANVRVEDGKPRGLLSFNSKADFYKILKQLPKEPVDGKYLNVRPARGFTPSRSLSRSSISRSRSNSRDYKPRRYRSKSRSVSPKAKPSENRPRRRYLSRSPSTPRRNSYNGRGSDNGENSKY